MILSFPVITGLPERTGRRFPGRANPIRVFAFLLAAGLWSAPAAAEIEAIPVGGGFTLRPIADARLRYEHVDQDGLAEPADALTVRLRTGLEAATASGFSLLAEAEATLPILADYDSGTNGRTSFPIVADPINVELNRLQLRYRPREGYAGTLGRQRIELDDQRFVGSSGWRQNEQTFDAVRLEARPGPINLDLSYAWSVRTIFGITAQELPPAAANKQAIGGDNVFAGAGVTLGPVQARAFAIIVDQDEQGRRQFSSQSYGLRATATLPLGEARLNLAGSYARQSDHAGNANDYSADYVALEAGAALSGFTLAAGYEELGASNGAAFTSFQNSARLAAQVQRLGGQVPGHPARRPARPLFHPRPYLHRSADPARAAGQRHLARIHQRPARPRLWQRMGRPIGLPHPPRPAAGQICQLRCRRLRHRHRESLAPARMVAVTK